MNKRSRVLALTLVVMLIMSTVAFAAPNEKASAAFDKKVLTKLDVNEAVKHVEYLSEVIGPRVATTQAERNAAEYIKDVLAGYGYKPEIQGFAYNESQSAVTVGGENIDAFGATGANYNGYGTFTGKLVDCGLGLLDDEFSSEVIDSVALIRRGAHPGMDGFFSIKARKAMEAGAKAVIIYNNTSASNPFGPSMQQEAINIPVVMISNADGLALLAQMSEEEVEATVSVELVEVYSQNVVAVKEPTNKKKNADIVYITAHYDSVPGSPGANDNASGTAMMLEFARILRNLPTDKEVRFIACGAEEVGLWGSLRYVEQLSENERNRSFANFNMDMIATSYPGLDILEVSTIDGEHNAVSLAAVEAGARLGNLSRIEAEYGISSDHRYFGQMLGIPHGGFIWVDERGQLEPYYHTPQDTMNMNFSIERFEKAGSIIGAAMYEMLRKETPNLKKSALRNAKPFLRSVVEE